MVELKAKEFKVSDAMSREPITLTEDSVLTEALGLMEGEEIHEIPVARRERLLGLLTLDDIMKRGKLQPKTKVKSLMRYPPKISPDMNLIEASRILLDNGFRGSPVVGGELLLGFISRGDILSKIPEMVDLKNITAEEIMSEPAITVMEHQPLTVAKDVLRDLRIRALPAIDENGKLVGILTQTAVAKAFAVSWVRAQRGDFGGDKAVKVEVMSLLDPPIWVERDTPVSDIPKMLESSGHCVVVEGLVPVGTVTPKDLLELVAREGRGGEGVMVQLVGAEEESNITVEMAYEVIHRYARKIARAVKLESIAVTVGRIDKGGKPYYELTCRVLYEGRVSTNKEEGWGFLPTIHELMREQTRILLHKKR